MNVLLPEFEQCELHGTHISVFHIKSKNVTVCYGSTQPSQWVLLSDLRFFVA